MSDTEATSPAPAEEVAEGVTAPAATPETANDDANKEALDNAETETDENGDEVTAEEIEFDFGGTKYKVAKGTPVDEVAEHLQKYAKGIEADYTRKSQEAAAIRKAAEEQAKVAQRLTNLSTERAAEYAKGVQAAQEIEQLSKIDLTALWQSNADQARMVSDRLAMLNSQYQQSQAQLAQYGQELNHAEQGFLEARAKEGEAIVAKAIKGWNAQSEAELVEWVQKKGVSKAEAAQWKLHPLTTQWAWQAMQYEKLQAKANSASKPPVPAAPSAPVTALKAPPSRTTKTAADLAKGDDAAAWLAARRAELRKQGRRA